MSEYIIKIVDPHLHLFSLQEGDYHWLKADNPPFWPDKHLIYRDTNEQELSLPPPLNLAGFVHIEAGYDNHRPWREIDWLEQHCKLPFKSVAFADITAETFTQSIQRLVQRKSVVGIRYILDEQAYDILTSAVTSEHFALLEKHNLSFDAQLSLADTRGVEQLKVLAKRFPALKIIINHGGWALADTSEESQAIWLGNLNTLSQCPNIAIKLSGWEMSNRNWRTQQVQGITSSCLQLLGEQRVMLASNFPLCTFSLSYSDLWSRYTQLPKIEPSCFDKISYSNAIDWYGLSLS